MNAEQSYPEKSLRDFFYILFRHKWKIVLFFLAVVTTVTAATLLMPEIYRSEAKILMRLGRESVTLDPTATTGQVISISQNRENEINSELEILNSRDLAEKVVDVLGPAAFLQKPALGPRKTRRQSGSAISSNPISTTLASLSEDVKAVFREAKAQVGEVLPESGISEQEKVVLAVMDNLNTEVLKKSNIIAVSFEAKDPQLARSTLDILLDTFLEKHMAVHRTAGSCSFFDQQTKELCAGIARTERRLRDLKNRTGVAALEEQRRILLCSNGACAPPRVIAVTSCRPNEGASTVAANLALLFSGLNQGRVLLVNADLGSEQKKVRNSGRVLIQHPNGRGIDFLSDLSEATAEAPLAERIDQWRGEYSHAVLDVPPILDQSAAVRIAGLAEGVVLVVEAEHLRWEVAERAKGLLEEAGAPLLGVVLNKRRYYVPGWLYRTL